MGVFVLHTGWVVTLGGHWTPENELLEVPQDDAKSVKAHHEKTEFRVYNDVLALNLAGGGRAWKALEIDGPFAARDDAAASITSEGTAVIFAGGTVYGGGGY